MTNSNQQSAISKLASREKTSAGSTLVEFGFIPKGTIGKTVGLSYETEAKL